MLLTAVSLCLLVPAPQDPVFETLDNGLRLRHAPVEGCDEQALVLLWPVGSENDPPEQSGLAQAVAELLTLHVRSGMQPQARVHGRFTVLHSTVHRSRAGEAAALLASLLAVEGEPDPDTVSRAIARAALRADDLAAILPGPILHARAQAALLVGTPGARAVGGDPRQILALDAAALQARRVACYGPAGAVVAGVGGCDEQQWAAVRAAFAAVPRRQDGDPGGVPVERDPGDAFLEHRLVDAPFVAAAFAAPDPADPGAPEFAVAMEVLRTRALLEFQKYRGHEHRALFPFLAYDFAAGDRLAVVGRRGRDGDHADRTRGEIDRFVAGLRDGRVTAQDTARAARVLALQLSLPPYDRAAARSLAEVPSGLLPRALAMALYARWQWSESLPARLVSVRPEAVQAVLNRVLDPGDLYWCGLLPAPAVLGR